MPFDLETWKAKLNERLQGWRPRMKQAGVSSLYAAVSAMSLWPVVEAARGGDWGALAALGSVVAGVGTNLLANQIQGWKDEVDAARQLSAALPQQPELRVELDEILEKLDALQAAQQQLPEAEQPEFTREISEELQRLGSRLTIKIISLRDGSYVEGDHSVGVGAGGTYIGGSVGGNVYLPGSTHNQASDPRKIEAEKQSDAKRRYLQRFYRRCCSLPLAAMGADESTGEDVTLDKVYIDLDTTTPVEMTEDEIKARQEKARFQIRDGQNTRALSALEASRDAERMVLLGDPGSGKSTYARYLLAWQAQVHTEGRQPADGLAPELLPVLIQLRDLVPRLNKLDLAALSVGKQPQVLVKLVREQIVEDLEGLEAQAYTEGLLDALREGQIFLVLDGLDEVPSAMRGQIRQVVHALFKEYSIRRVLITCRVRSYVGDALYPDFQAYTLAPFDEQQVRGFAREWYKAQLGLGRLTGRQSQDKAADLAQVALDEDLRELSSNPMLLTTMAIIHQRDIGLPRERVRLYSLAVDVLLRRWQKHKTGEKEMAPSTALIEFLKDDERLRSTLERLAYEAHATDQGGEEAADLLRGEALTLLEDQQYLRRADLASEFLDYVDQRAGLLVGRGGEADKPTSYSFPHRTFQEYLAGCYIIGLREAEAERELFRRAGEGDDWSLAAQLGAEELVYNRRGQYPLLNLAYQLCCNPTDTQHQRALLWSGNMAALLGSEIIQRDSGAPNGGNVYLEQLKPRLVALLGGELSPLERAEAGRDLALLGDPRPEVTTLHGMEFCFVPGGPFRMGSEKSVDPQADDDEAPVSEVALPSYWLSRFPVTNAQYTAFIQADGYREARFWKEAQREEIWIDGQVKGRYESEPRQAPVNFGTPFNLPNHPVVGVTWYEALAFCRWLAAYSRGQGWLPVKWQVSLPSEAEWEKASRGGSMVPAQPILNSLLSGLPVPEAISLLDNPLPARQYPWGEKFDPARANSSESGIRSTSAAGCFPGGASLYGLQDMSGNVWEWTRNLWGDYPYSIEGKDRVKRENLAAPKETLRVLRGGAFVANAWWVRCAYRNWFYPDLRYDFIGFRVVVSPFDSGL